jgi:hypothetical protein
MTTPWQPPGPFDPPTPPTAAEPRRAQPRYGEYAPPGYISPVPSQLVQPAAPAPQDSTQQQPVYYAQPAIVRPVRTADIVVTSILLFLGLVGLLFGITAPELFPAALAKDYSKLGLQYAQPSALGTITTVVWISHVVLWLAALGGALALMLKRRVAFWAPLAAGIIAAVIFWGALIVMIATDPAFINAVRAGQ